MRRPGRFLVLCLLLVLLPLRSLLAAAQLDCGPTQPTPAVAAQGDHAHHDHHASNPDADADSGSAACKLCAPCCLAAAPPPAPVLTPSASPSERVSQVPAERWAGVVPPLPDPPPRT